MRIPSRPKIRSPSRGALFSLLVVATLTGASTLGLGVLGNLGRDASPPQRAPDAIHSPAPANDQGDAKTYPTIAGSGGGVDRPQREREQGTPDEAQHRRALLLLMLGGGARPFDAFR